jgi:alcohol dehydrogenase
MITSNATKNLSPHNMTPTATTTMKAAIATGFGDIDDNIFLRDNVPKPTLQDLSESERSEHLVIRVLACALAPGDVRLLSGETDYIQLPKSGHPYVIGSDVCGIVCEIPVGDTKFRVSDIVVSRFDESKPTGGVGEYRLCKRNLTEHAPKSIPPVEACTLPASAMAAKVLARQFVLENKKTKAPRVLILGGSGGVGTFLCQYCKLYGASYIAATSTQCKLVRSLGVDQVIDYRKQNWWEIQEYHSNKFDVVFDLVNGDNWQRGACSGKAVQRKGAYVQLLSGVETTITVHGPLDIMKLMMEWVARSLYCRLNPKVPIWYTPEALKLEEGDLRELFRDDVDSNKIKVILDPASPFPFTQDGVRQAMALQKSIHAHGKVVLKIADK